jgi:hypothetical protein
VRVATIVLLMVALALMVGIPHAPGNAGEDARYERAHAAAVDYRRQRDHLQELLTQRVMANMRLRRALKQKIAITGGHPLERAFLCIYSHENGGYGWTANTGNSYYGGLQMDRGFQATYGPEFVRAFGTADRWPASVQIAVAIKAYLSGRGFRPWPTTARLCGLI